MPHTKIAKNLETRTAALKELLGGLADLGFGSDNEINGADAVDAISSLYTSVIHKLRDTDIAPRVIRHNDGTFWCESFNEWVDAPLFATDIFDATLPSKFDPSECALILRSEALIEEEIKAQRPTA